MAAWVCADCTTVYSVGAPRCPHCHATAYSVQGEPMPKITVAGGATSRHDPETAGAVEPPASTAPAPNDGGVSSPGSSSSASSKTSEPNETAPRARARTTASRSKKAPTGSSSADGTDGDPAEGTSASK